MFFSKNLKFLRKNQKLKVDIQNIETIDKNTSDKVINYLKSLRHNFLNTRNLLIIQLLKDTGANLNEIDNITLKNVKIDLKAVYLSFTKTNKHRIIKLRLRNYIFSLFYL